MLALFFSVDDGIDASGHKTLPSNLGRMMICQVLWKHWVFFEDYTGNSSMLC